MCVCVFINKSVYLSDAGPGEGHDDSHYVDRELELQELGDAIVDISSPHHRLDNAAEVVVSQDDVRRLFSHVCPRDALTWIDTEWGGHRDSRRDSCKRSSIQIILECYCLNIVLSRLQVLPLSVSKSCGQTQMHTIKKKIVLLLIKYNIYCF